MNQNNYYHKVRLWTNQKTISKLIVATSGVLCEADVWPCKIGPSLCAYQQYKTYILMGKRHFAPLFYPWSGNKPPNVLKLLDNPPELANVWQNLPSVHSPVCLNGKLVICNSHDHLSKNHSKIAHLLNAAFQYLFVWKSSSSLPTPLTRFFMHRNSKLHVHLLHLPINIVQENLSRTGSLPIPRHDSRREYRA
jgi:hypothetical protein